MALETRKTEIESIQFQAQIANEKPFANSRPNRKEKKKNCVVNKFFPFKRLNTFRMAHTRTWENARSLDDNDAVCSIDKADYIW